MFLLHLKITKCSHFLFNSLEIIHCIWKMAHCDVTDAAVLGCLLCLHKTWCSLMWSELSGAGHHDARAASGVGSCFAGRHGGNWWQNETLHAGGVLLRLLQVHRPKNMIDRYSCFKNKYLLFWWSSAFIPESCDLCVTCSCQASSQTHPEPGDGHEESRERQAVELHPRAAETAAAEEGRQPRGAGSGRLHVFYRYPLNCRLVDHQADSELMLCSD